MISTISFLCLLLIVMMASSFATPTADIDDNCGFWAESGECFKNPTYMLQNCATSCAKYPSKTRASPFETFYDIIDRDIFGNDFSFDVFRGKVVYIVNVASYCGYTEENYAILRQLKKYIKSGLELVIAPSNQFGFQEPGDAIAIAKFAMKEEFDGTILQKADVNGPGTRPSFVFLKEAVNKQHIQWNFDGKFLISREGKVFVPSANIEEDVQALLEGDEL